MMSKDFRGMGRDPPLLAFHTNLPCLSGLLPLEEGTEQLQQRGFWCSDGMYNSLQHYSAIGVADKLPYGTKGRQEGSFISPAHMTVAKNGTIAVVDAGNHRIQLLKKGSLQPIQSLGSRGGTNYPGRVQEPKGVVIAGDDTKGPNKRAIMLVADTGNNRLQAWSMYAFQEQLKTSSADSAERLGTLGVFGSKGSTPGNFSQPVDIAFWAGRATSTSSSSRQRTGNPKANTSSSDNNNNKGKDNKEDDNIDTLRSGRGGISLDTSSSNHQGVKVDDLYCSLSSNRGDDLYCSLSGSSMSGSGSVGSSIGSSDVGSGSGGGATDEGGSSSVSESSTNSMPPKQLVIQHPQSAEETSAARAAAVAKAITAGEALVPDWFVAEGQTEEDVAYRLCYPADHEEAKDEKEEGGGGRPRVKEDEEAQTEEQLRAAKEKAADGSASSSALKRRMGAFFMRQTDDPGVVQLLFVAGKGGPSDPAVVAKRKRMKLRRLRNEHGELLAGAEGDHQEEEDDHDHQDDHHHDDHRNLRKGEGEVSLADESLDEYDDGSTNMPSSSSLDDDSLSVTTAMTELTDAFGPSGGSLSQESLGEAALRRQARKRQRKRDKSMRRLKEGIIQSKFIHVSREGVKPYQIIKCTVDGHSYPCLRTLSLDQPYLGRPSPDTKRARNGSDPRHRAVVAVADKANGRVQLLSYAPPNGMFFSVTLSPLLSLQDGLKLPVSVSFSEEGELYVADAGTKQVVVFACLSGVWQRVQTIAALSPAEEKEQEDIDQKQQGEKEKKQRKKRKEEEEEEEGKEEVEEEEEEKKKKDNDEEGKEGKKGPSLPSYLNPFPVLTPVIRGVPSVVRVGNVSDGSLLRTRRRALVVASQDGRVVALSTPPLVPCGVFDTWHRDTLLKALSFLSYRDASTVASLSHFFKDTHRELRQKWLLHPLTPMRLARVKLHFLLWSRTGEGSHLPNHDKLEDKDGKQLCDSFLRPEMDECHRAYCPYSHEQPRVDALVTLACTPSSGHGGAFIGFEDGLMHVISKAHGNRFYWENQGTLHLLFSRLSCLAPLRSRRDPMRRGLEANTMREEAQDHKMALTYPAFLELMTVVFEHTNGLRDWNRYISSLSSSSSTPSSSSCSSPSSFRRGEGKEGDDEKEDDDTDDYREDAGDGDDENDREEWKSGCGKGSLGKKKNGHYREGRRRRGRGRGDGSLPHSAQDHKQDQGPHSSSPTIEGVGGGMEGGLGAIGDHRWDDEDPSSTLNQVFAVRLGEVESLVQGMFS